MSIAVRHVDCVPYSEISLVNPIDITKIQIGTRQTGQGGLVVLLYLRRRRRPSFPHAAARPGAGESNGPRLRRPPSVPPGDLATATGGTQVCPVPNPQWMTGVVGPDPRFRLVASSIRKASDSRLPAVTPSRNNIFCLLFLAEVYYSYVISNIQRCSNDQMVFF
ncbi:hypothetical protein PAHAL_7G076600 [Panicum hallii]|uniref:Uncharacterized protein n=1 Tax=Panicum hallii TaxID=206008 RepID=A0A2T8IBB9_9POAL|nr:hypothetical protein PAHAL_7G076600 [Panicum hallii]